MRQNIINRNSSWIQYPTLTKPYHDINVTDLPSNEEIKEEIAKAYQAARQAMLEVGISEQDIDVAASINLKVNGRPQDTEFVDIGDEYVNESDDDKSENDTPNDESCYSNDLSAYVTQESARTQIATQKNASVYLASELFPNMHEELDLKSSRVGSRHTFSILDSNGNVKAIKKSTFLWMLTTGRQSPSTDRTRRFMNDK